MTSNVKTWPRFVRHPIGWIAGLFSLGWRLSAEVPAPLRMPLWPGPAPVDSRQATNESAFITVFRPEKPNGASIIICPGGGYGGLVTGPEGSGIAKWLNQHDILGVVLEYRLPHGRPRVPLSDAQQAIRTVRTKAPDWSCDPNRVGILGFSAGGHLASTAATHFDTGNPAALEPFARQGCRPDFAILIYPVISMGFKGHAGSRHNLLGETPTPEEVIYFSSEQQVTATTPPTFLAHAVDDRVVSVDNSRMFYQALLAQGVPGKLLELPSGDHGLNGYQGPMWDAWQQSSLKWLAERKLIPAP